MGMRMTEIYVIHLNFKVQSTFLCCLKVIFCLYVGTNSIIHLGSKFIFYSVVGKKLAFIEQLPLDIRCESNEC